MTPPFHGGLVRLALRRALSPPRLAVMALFLAPCVAWSLPSPLGELAAGPSSAELRHAAARQALWTVTLAALALLVATHAARTVGRWRKDELGWRATRPVGAGVQLASSWLGQTLALALLLALGALAIEVAASDRSDVQPARERSAWRELRALAGPHGRWIGRDQPLRWRIDDPGSGAHGATIEVASAYGTPFVDVGWRAGARSGSARVHGRATLALELDGGRGPIDVELAFSDGADGADDGVARVTPDGPRGPRLWRVERAGPWRAGFELGARAALAGAALVAFALAAGAWLGGGTAALLTLAALVAASADGAPRWLPASGLPRALAVVGEGRLPAAPSWTELAAALATTLAALALARLGLARWSER